MVTSGRLIFSAYAYLSLFLTWAIARCVGMRAGFRGNSKQSDSCVKSYGRPFEIVFNTLYHLINIYESARNRFMTKRPHSLIHKL